MLASARQPFVDWVAYAVVRALVAVIQVVPLDMGQSMCNSIAAIADGVLRIRRKITEENIHRVFPDATHDQKRHLRRQMWQHLLLMVCEIAWAQRRLHLTNWSKYVRFRDNRQMLRMLMEKRPVVMVTGHYGNFELAGYVSGLMGFRTLAIARRLDNVFLHRWVESFRSARGQEMVDKEGCAPVVDAHLAANGTLSLLADQHAGDRGCWVDFLGSPASSHKALAVFSLAADAPMVVSATTRIRGAPMCVEMGIYGVADPREADSPSDVSSLTRWYNEKLGEAIATAPEQYWWLHRRWRDPPARVQKRLARMAA
ncbi:MAG: lysophospholipid acyltransferase family protein [Planctomycetota bacterium]